MTFIAPSILASDFGYLGKSVREIYAWGGDMAHCDVMDGRYVNNITFGMETVAALHRYEPKLPLNVHLMIVSPEDYVEGFIKAGAADILFHSEVCSDTVKTLNQIKDAGLRAGLVLNPGQRIDSVLPYLELTDIIMFMGVKPGFGGQKIHLEVLPEITKLKNIITERKLNILLEFDGGITEDNVELVKKAGVDIVVAGSAVFKSADPKATIERLRG